MKKALLILILTIVSNQGIGQTCCSGGVPVSSNIGFQSSDGGILQLSLSADFNILKRLKSGSETLDDDQRLRTTQSYIIRGAYAFNNRLTLETFFPVIRQTRKISSLLGSTDREATFGIGDPLTLLIYNILDKSVTLRVGLGPQIPLGSSNETNDIGLTLLEDLQPGSGAWDLVIFGSFEYQLPSKPSAMIYANVIRSLTGANNNSRNGAQKYEFGNDIQLIAGISDQIFIRNQVITPGISFRYRHAQRDLVNGNGIPGTGGDFVFARFSNGIPFPKINSSLNINLEIPLWSKVNETQLATTYILNIGWFKTFEPKQVNNSIINLN